MSIVSNSKRILQQRIQKIEQGMGRGIRSSSDYCVVILMGDELTNAIYTNRAFDYFSEATKKQYELSEKICEDADDFQEIKEFINDVLDRKESWVTISKEYISDIKYNTEVNYDKLIIAQRKAYNFCRKKEYEKANYILQEVIQSIEDDALKGYIEQQRAECLNLFDRTAAQELLISAKSKNAYILNPIIGIQSSRKLEKSNISQARAVVEFAQKNKLDRNGYIFYINDILDKLVYEKNTHEGFENSIMLILQALGFEANRPEKESGYGPDNFCILPDGSMLVIECKNEVINDTISKHDCDQLLDSMNWFKKFYPSNHGIPVMIHRGFTYDKCAFPDRETQIITPELLENFKAKVQAWCVAFTRSENYLKEDKIEQLLVDYELRGQDIIRSYTRKYKK